MLQKGLQILPYHVQLVQFVKSAYHVERINFCINLKEAMGENDLDCFVFSDEAMLQIVVLLFLLGVYQGQSVCATCTYQHI